MTRIAFVGAGSVEFTRDLLGDILSFPELADATIALHDIDPERLATGEAMARWTNQALGADATIEAHLDRRAALEGCDHVINMIQVGGHEATLIDFEIPKRHGLRQTIGDTLGIGGIFRSLRTIPVMLGIAADMSELCPNAWLLNYTNPMAMLCWATYEASPQTRIVGLCHSVQNTTRELAELSGVPYDEVTYLGAGINHQSWILRFERDGEDLYPLLDAALDRDPELLRRVRVEIYRRFGRFPTESSEHSAEYLPYFLRSDEMIERFRVPVDEYVHRSEENLEMYEQMRAQLAAGEPFQIERSLEYASLIIHSQVTGEPRTIYGNVRNDGLIPNLPHGCCVEVPCLADRAGVQPTAVGALPPQLAALNRTFANVCELTVRAALDGSRQHVYHAALLDPNAAGTLSPEAICAMVDDLIDAHGDAIDERIRSDSRRSVIRWESSMRMFNTTVGRLVLTACVAGLIAAAIGGVSLARAGGTNHGRTIRVTEVDTGGKFISITHTANGGPGDEFIFSANLRHAGHKVGTLDAMCTLMLHNKLQCQGTFKLLGGTITGTALLPANEPNGSTDHIAITGGTGTFHGASGEVLSTSINNNVSRDVIRLD
jgi:alpha-galactosidase